MTAKVHMMLALNKSCKGSTALLLAASTNKSMLSIKNPIAANSIHTSAVMQYPRRTTDIAFTLHVPAVPDGLTPFLQLQTKPCCLEAYNVSPQAQSGACL